MSHLPPRPQSTVLVVDDEVQLRAYMARVLGDQGTDVVMPFMTGPELAAELAAQPLPPPVLFVSGGHTLRDVPGPVLHKPFLPADLTTLVHSLIRGGAEISLGLLD
jgi:CheY-like chemotaxis protein